MKNLGQIVHAKDITTKEYVDRLFEEASRANEERLKEKIGNYVSDIALGDANGPLLDAISIEGEDGYTSMRPYIPVASMTTLGLVRASAPDLMNGITIDGEGNVVVNKIEISKIVVPEGEELIFDCGTATQKTKL